MGISVPLNRGLGGGTGSVGLKVGENLTGVYGTTG